HPEEAGLGVDGPQSALVVETHPGDVVTDGLDLPSGDGRLEHGEVGLATGAREGRRDVVGLAPGWGDLEDQHVFGEPALVPGHGRCDTQRVALLAEQGVAAVARTVGPDLPGLGKVRDVLGGVARPGDVLLAGLQWGAHGMDRLDEVATLLDETQGRRSHTCHDPHGHHDVGGVGDLDTELGDVAAEGAHAEGDDVHRAPAHGASENFVEGGAHRVRGDPVVGRARVLFAFGADEGAVLHTRDVARVRCCVEAVGAFGRVETFESAFVHEKVRQPGPLLVGTVTPHDLVGLCEFCDLSYPSNESFVCGRYNAHIGPHVCSHCGSFSNDEITRIMNDDCPQ